jgi:hypothetical protein
LNLTTGLVANAGLVYITGFTPDVEASRPTK